MITTDESTCPDCGGSLKYYDSVTRIAIRKRRTIEHVKIRRLHCTDCGKLHRELPDDIFPYKQYDADIIQGVVEGLITCETIGFEDYPCEMTMFRWKTQDIQMLL